MLIVWKLKNGERGSDFLHWPVSYLPIILWHVLSCGKRQRT